MYPAADPLHPTTSVESDSPIISMAQTCVLALIILIPLVGLVIEPVEADIRPRQAHVSLLLHFQLSFIYHPVTLRPCVSRRKHILRILTVTNLHKIMSSYSNTSFRKKVAIVGSGCSGIAALWALNRTYHDVHLYEAADRLGGHTNTVQWSVGKYKTSVDTGFIVLNSATYRE